MMCREAPREALRLWPFALALRGLFKKPRKKTTNSKQRRRCFVARAMVPPGNVRYYFLIGGVAQHNPDAPSMPLDIKFLVKKRRPIGSDSSWSRVASKYTSRPRCNVRSVPSRVGYLMTACKPRPTGFNWVTEAVFEEDGEDYADATTSICEDKLKQETTNQAPVKRDSSESVLSSEPVSTLGITMTEDLVAHMWAAKAGDDMAATECSQPVQPLEPYTISHFIERLRGFRRKTIEAFMHAVKSHRQKRREYDGLES